MTVSPAAALAEPIAGDDPCGPDLFDTDDIKFMQFMSHAEGLLPASFFSAEDGSPFDRGKVDLKGPAAEAAPFLARTKDVRLLVLLAKFRLLDRDLQGFADHAAVIADILAKYWDGVHPRGTNGDFTLRLAALQSLDDLATVAMPMQHVPLARPARGAAIAMRAQLIASGDITARDEEEQPDASAIERALKECEISQLVEARGSILQAEAAYQRIRDITVGQTSHSVAAKFVRLNPLMAKTIAFLNEAIERRDPSLATAHGSAAAGGDGAEGAARAGPAAGEINGPRSVAAALGAVERYFCVAEPSNPGLLLVRQAIQLIGKTFMEAVNILAPSFVDQAAVNIGRTDVFQLPLQRLADFSSVTGAEDDGAPQPPAMEARSRAEANTLMTQVIAYYAQAEPSSPIPFLIERARALAGRDFLSILKDILPENTLRNLHSGNRT